MFRYLYRQRRRLLVTTLFATLGFMLMADVPAALAHLSYDRWITYTAVALTTLILATGVCAAAAVFIVLLPNWRTMCELLALHMFALGIVQHWAPGIYDTPLIGPVVPLLLIILLYSVTYGEALDRFRIWVDHRATRRFTSPKTPEALWVELVPGEGGIEDHWDSLLYELEADEDDDDSLHVKYTHGGSLYELQTMTYLQKTAPSHAKYYHVGQVDPKNRSLVEGTYEIRITPNSRDQGCVVTLTSCRHAMLLRQALLEWFDDSLGDRTDHLAARHRGVRDWSSTGRFRRKVQQYA